MKLSSKTLTRMAEMICGTSRDWAGGERYSWPNFPERSANNIVKFFEDCDVDSQAETTVRKGRVLEVLNRVNEEPSEDSTLPSASLVRVVQEIFDPRTFEAAGRDRAAAASELSAELERDNLELFADQAGRYQIRTVDGGAQTAGPLLRRVWTPAELRHREELTEYLTEAAEDDLIEKVLVPMFSQLRFSRVSAAGHHDKALEFGRDLWMRYRLPTGHYIYLGAQVKKGKLDSAGRTRNENIAEVLAQVRMMLERPVLDPETNKKVLLDHIFIICSGKITKQAKEWLEDCLDAEGRRRVLFMDREELLDTLIGTNIRLPDVFDDADGY
jgi:hypothetical protein